MLVDNAMELSKNFVNEKQSDSVYQRQKRRIKVVETYLNKSWLDILVLLGCLLYYVRL